VINGVISMTPQTKQNKNKIKVPEVGTRDLQLPKTSEAVGRQTASLFSEEDLQE